MIRENCPLVLACSPRKGGNCDLAASLVHKAVEGSRLLFLRDTAVAPCVSCGSCATPHAHCPQEQTDASAPLFAALERASALVIVAPVYFYHIPAQLKSLVDRTQICWRAKQATAAAGGSFPPSRPAWSVLVGARPTGAKLFEGSLLTLRYWFDALGYTPGAPLTLYGLDGPADLAGSQTQQKAVRQYAAKTILPHLFADTA